MTGHGGYGLKIPALLVGTVILLVLGWAAFYIFREKASLVDGRKFQRENAAPENQSFSTFPITSPNPKPMKQVVLMPIAQTTTALNSPDASAEQDLATLEMILREYRRQYQGNPSGENVEISAALMGKNDRGLGFIPKLGKNQMNAQGELIDRWGTAYFFHVESSTEMEIRSAGKDGEFYTEDDTISSPKAGE